LAGLSAHARQDRSELPELGFPGLDAFELDTHLLAQLEIEVRQRLVEQQQPRTRTSPAPVVRAESSSEGAIRRSEPATNK
jgi:hypothetical protein